MSTLLELINLCVGFAEQAAAAGEIPGAHAEAAFATRQRDEIRAEIERRIHRLDQARATARTGAELRDIIIRVLNGERT